jgi:hypothetical protein
VDVIDGIGQVSVVESPDYARLKLNFASRNSSAVEYIAGNIEVSSQLIWLMATDIAAAYAPWACERLRPVIVKFQNNPQLAQLPRVGHLPSHISQYKH